jgi:hypothetical protein
MLVRLLAVCSAALALTACGGSDVSNSSTGNASQTASVSSTSQPQAPTISGTPATSVVAGSAYSFTPTATAPSGGTLVFSIKNMPSWAAFNAQTGQLAGTPASADVGSDANVEISVSDGTASAALSPFGITVTSASAPPSSPPPSSPPTTAGGSCSTTSGSLQLSAKVVRTSGISPLMAFFDASATTDSAAAVSVTQDVHFAWSFGDSGASGDGKWGYGSNPSTNSMNAGTGIVVAHLYRTAGSDTGYTATVTATDGTNTASCNIGVTVYDPSGSNGFPAAATTCVSSSSTPVAGSGGCPAGAAVLKTSSIQSALSSGYGNGKRLLFMCGDTFSGDTGGNPNVTAVKARIGAYGGCEDTQTNRPIMSNSGTSSIFQMNGSTGDNVFSDLDCEGNGIGGSNGGASMGGCISSVDGADGVMYQNTIYNVNSSGEVQSFFWNQCSQCAIVQSVMTSMGNSTSDTWIGVYVNGDGYAHYPYSGNTFNNIYYQALIGNHFDGGTAYYANNAETVRVFACPYCYIANNDFLNAGPAYAVLKFHEANPTSTWVGQYTWYDEISDNYFGGSSGYLTDSCPQNTSNDERLRYIVIERNVYFPGTNATLARLTCGQYITVRDDAYHLSSGTGFGIMICNDGIEPAPQYIEAYNNTFYAPSGGTLDLIQYGNTYCSGSTQPSNSIIKNNLGYTPGQSPIMVNVVSGATATVSNNTSNADLTSNPGFTDASGTFQKISDYKPTANYSGGTSVPNWYDALGTAWSPTWDLGAVDP